MQMSPAVRTTHLPAVKQFQVKTRLFLALQAAHSPGELMVHSGPIGGAGIDHMKLLMFSLLATLAPATVTMSTLYKVRQDLRVEDPLVALNAAFS